MKNTLFACILMLLPFCVSAQQYDESIRQYREAYKMSLLHGADSLKAEDTAYLRFYPIDSTFRVRASFEQVTGATPFRMPTKHGKVGPQVREYGPVYFKMKGSAITLHVYRILARANFRMLAHDVDNPEENMVLFIPFTDRTNNKETFLGGRYLEVSSQMLQSGHVVLDFNKTCNPHTAYVKGYPYVMLPLIPDMSSPLERTTTRLMSGEVVSEYATIQANDLHLDIKAGEKIFGHNPGY